MNPANQNPGERAVVVAEEDFNFTDTKLAKTRLVYRGQVHFGRNMFNPDNFAFTLVYRGVHYCRSKLVSLAPTSKIKERLRYRGVKH